MRKFKKTICFDLDNTLCRTKGSDYLNAKPIHKNIKFVNELYENNFYILIFTARHMGKFKEKRSKAIAYGFKNTKNQIKRWGLKFHRLEMGKPSYDYIIDDKSIFFKKNWINELKSKLKI
tara:strand:- start:1017 stop:1376 length:360 start_codon:yes stop_codon:yes gene_type:complete